MLNRQKSYGIKYKQNTIKIKINRRKLLKIIIIMLFFCEIILGVLWALGK